MGWMFVGMSVLYVIMAVFIVFIILIQPHHGEGGLAAAFGGVGGDSFFGTKAVNQIAKFTIWMSVIFIALAVWLNRLERSGVKTGGSVFSGEKAGSPPAATDGAPPVAPSDQHVPPATPPSGTPPAAPPSSAPPAEAPPTSSTPAPPPAPAPGPGTSGETAPKGQPAPPK